MIGVHRTMINHYECRKHSPKWEKVTKLAAALGISVDEFAKPPPQE
ncbi:helix-turn-helix domain-containing protein [Rhizobium lusitanum]